MIMLQDKGIPYLVKEREFPECKGNSPYQIVQNLCEVFKADKLPEEHVWLICMDAACRLTAVHEISKGTVNASLIDMKAIMSRVLLSGACNIALLHNHPGGNLNPSREDDEVKDKLKQACQMMDVTLCDFIIVGNGYYSYAEEGRL
jgi:DNA repair protein RadC